MARFFLDHQRSKLGGRHRPHLNVVVDAADVEGRRGGSVLGGPNLPATTIERLLCGCALHRVSLDASGSVLDDGRAARTAPVPLFNALVVRDETCRFPGCDRPPAWCEAHHIWPWEDGGPTAEHNLVLLCVRHHHRLHSPGWSVKLLPSGTVEVTDPRGIVSTSAPPRRVRERANAGTAPVRAGPEP